MKLTGLEDRLIYIRLTRSGSARTVASTSMGATASFKRGAIGPAVLQGLWVLTGAQ